MKKKIVILAVIITGILFPMASISKYSSIYSAVFSQMFRSLGAHIFLHSVLFIALGMCLIGIFPNQTTWKLALLILVVNLLMAVGQESFQALSINSLRVSDTLFDLGVDTTATLGLIAALILYRRWQKSAQEIKPHRRIPLK